MPRNVTALEHVPLGAIQVSHIPAEKFGEIAGWDKLNPEQQALIRQETREVAKALVTQGLSELSLGEHLAKIHDELAPHRFMWLRYCKNFHFSWRTAYRYIKKYENARDHLPAPLLKAAMSRGLRIVGETPEEPLGAYTQVLKRLPPPKTQDPDKLNNYLDTMEEAFKERQHRRKSRVAPPEPRDPGASLVEAFRTTDAGIRELSGRAKTNWLRNLVGMLLTRAGVANPMTFEPIAVPEGFVAVRGRPRASKAAGAA